MTVGKHCTVECTRTPECAVCGREKALSGRDYAPAAAGGRCSHDCPGYRLEPSAGHLWRSEWQAHVDGDHSGCDCGLSAGGAS